MDNKSKMQDKVENCDDTAGNKDPVKCEEEIKEEIESNDLTLLEHLSENERIEMVWINEDENFQLKNDFDLKSECRDGDDTDQSTYEYDVGDGENDIDETNYNFLEFDDSITNQIKTREVCNSRDSVNGNEFTCDSKRNIGDDDDDIAKKTFLMQHNLKHNVKNNTQFFKCQHCTYKTHDKNNLTRHIKSHKNIKDFKCTFCSKIFSWKVNLDDHLFRIHQCTDVSEKLYNCDQCSYKTIRKANILEHKIKHGITDGVSIWKCPQCTFETYRKSSFNKHVKRHENIKDFKCSLCSKAFNQKIQLDEHLLKIHKDKGAVKKRYSCNDCSYEAVRERELLLHKLKHGITGDFLMLRCPQCTFQTFRKTSLNKHIKLHDNIKDFKCTFCSKEFTVKHSLNDHLLRIHKYSDATKKLHSCDQCSCEFLAKRDLLKHKIKHGITEGMPSLKCSQCAFETYRQSSFFKHARTHRKGKDFKCTYCSTEFSYKSSLNRHLLKFHS